MIWLVDFIICLFYQRQHQHLIEVVDLEFIRNSDIHKGVVTAVTGAIGSLSGGALVSRFKMRAVDGIRLVLFTSLLFATGILILMNLACPQVEMDMNYDEKLGMLVLHGWFKASIFLNWLIFCILYVLIHQEYNHQRLQQTVPLYD